MTRRRTLLSCRTISMHYIDVVLRPRAIPFHHNKVTYQYDDARPYYALIVRQFLAQNKVNVLACPAATPDPIPL